MHQSAGTRQTSTDQPLTDHAQMRMGQRGITEKVVALVLLHGRTVHARGATYRVIGHKEVSRCAQRGIDLTDADGVHVLLAADGSVITAYRNHELRKIRPTKRRHRIYH
ncbi:MAG: DUF4258 domain-containing protein [Azonexus sp.]|nr:DUF4258 domain-containing protein [Azonexus sp.]